MLAFLTSVTETVLFEKSGANWPKERHDPSGKSSGRCDCRYPFSDKTFIFPTHSSDLDSRNEFK